MAWDDEKKAAVVEQYLAADPTPETSSEIVKSIAEEIEESANGVRMILSKAGVYVKKSPESASKGTSKGSGGGSGRVSKQDAIDALVAALTDAGQPVDATIVDKLTGKAAVYFTSIVTNLTKVA